jgi:CHAD domain-containing protein
MTNPKNHVSKAALETDLGGERSLTLGDYAHTVIGQQYRRIVKREKKVLADDDPDNLHQMRVGTRRLRTALQVFDIAIELPKAASLKRLSVLGKVLGRLRDLDVQTAMLKHEYQPRLNKAEQGLVNKVLDALHKQRRKAFAGTEDTLKRSLYQEFKTAYETWLHHPQFKPVAQLPLSSLLPELLSPLLSKVLLHSGWLVAADNLSGENSVLLHDLRKACKHVRYQAEFFTDFYNPEFQNWVEEIKNLQERLGKVQDGQVLLELLAEELPGTAKWPELEAIVQQEQSEALDNWDIIRQQYLDSNFRHHLHQMILEPTQRFGISDDRVAVAALSGQ